MQRLKRAAGRLVTRWRLTILLLVVIAVIASVWIRKAHVPEAVILALTLLGSTTIAIVQWDSLSEAQKVKYRLPMILGVLCIAFAIIYAINALRIAATPSP